MITRTTSEVARHATRSTIQIRCVSSTANAPLRRDTSPKNSEHGHQIWVYNHLQRNHVVYSLTKSLNNNASLRQIPFNGKKTVPAALRKDLWHLLATIRFSPSSSSSTTTDTSSSSPSTITTSPTPSAIGLSVFQKLREYRKRHELEWTQSDFLNDKGHPLDKTTRSRSLCDQKANSIADMAAVLARLSVADKEQVARSRAAEKGSIGLIGEGSGERVEVRWWDLTDAEFAETWSENVEHGLLEFSTNNRGPKVWGQRDMESEVHAEAKISRRKEGAKRRWLAAGGEVDGVEHETEKVTV